MNKLKQLTELVLNAFPPKTATILLLSNARNHSRLRLKINYDDTHETCLCHEHTHQQMYPLNLLDLWNHCMDVK